MRMKPRFQTPRSLENASYSLAICETSTLPIRPFPNCVPVPFDTESLTHSPFLTPEHEHITPKLLPLSHKHKHKHKHKHHGQSPFRDVGHSMNRRSLENASHSLDICEDSNLPIRPFPIAPVLFHAEYLAHSPFLTREHTHTMVMTITRQGETDQASGGTSGNVSIFAWGFPVGHLSEAGLSMSKAESPPGAMTHCIVEVTD
jgi:hypothetical protein